VSREQYFEANLNLVLKRIPSHQMAFCAYKATDFSKENFK
jgi:hypothetical protein